jgi:hypothetical protein
LPMPIFSRAGIGNPAPFNAQISKDGFSGSLVRPNGSFSQMRSCA